MFCPKCATQNVDGASYCRSCGANISQVPLALTGQLPVADQPQSAIVMTRHRKRRREPSVEEAIRRIMMGVAFAVISILVGKIVPVDGPVVLDAHSCRDVICQRFSLSRRDVRMSRSESDILGAAAYSVLPDAVSRRLNRRVDDSGAECH